MAAIIASQALISGAFSLTRQAVQLGYLPRVTVVHTSRKTEGQIYIPEINWRPDGRRASRSCSRSGLELEARRGVRHRGHRHDGDHVVPVLPRVSPQLGLVARPRRSLLIVPFLAIDSRSSRRTSSRSSTAAGSRSRSGSCVFIDHDDLVARPRSSSSKTMRDGHDPRRRCSSPTSPTTPLPRVPGTAVFMTSTPDGMPNVLLHHVKHNKVLHEQVVLLSIVTENVPCVRPATRRSRCASSATASTACVARVGFMQTPNVPRAARALRGAAASGRVR